MEIKLKLIGLFVLAVAFTHCGNAQGQKGMEKKIPNADSAIVANRNLLKDYFLCSCIDKGFKDEKLLYAKDHSSAVLVEMAQYDPEAFQSVDSIAHKFVNSIPVSDLTSKRGIMINCIQFYKGKELDLLVRNLDKKLYPSVKK